jgi:hypothetical protein
MADIRPRISVEYRGDATIVAFTDEKILEETDIKALQESIMSVIEQAVCGSRTSDKDPKADLRARG